MRRLPLDQKVGGYVTNGLDHVLSGRASTLVVVDKFLCPGGRGASESKAEDDILAGALPVLDSVIHRRGFEAGSAVLFPADAIGFLPLRIIHPAT